MRSKSELLILQNQIPHYRLPLYNLLAEASGINLTVIHSGKPLEQGKKKIFNEVIVPCRKFGPFYLQKGIKKYVDQANFVVSMFDLHWPACLLPIWYAPTKTILWGHGFGSSKIARHVRLFLAKKAAAIMLYEKSAADEFIKYGCRKEKTFFSGNTVHVPNSGIEEAPRNQFLFVGRLQERKRIDQLLNVFAKIQEGLSPDIGITIVGDGDARDSLELLVDELNLRNRVRFLGPINDDNKLKNVFTHALAYVSPGHVGLGVLHSFAYGIPVITSRNANHGPEVENIKNNVNGLFFDGDNDGLKKCLLRLLKDPLISYKMGEAAFQYYQSNRTMEKMVKRFLEAIEYVGINKD